LWTPIPTSIREAEIIRENYALSSKMCDARDKHHPWDTRIRKEQANATHVTAKA
jgi:hypothetical protein